MVLAVFFGAGGSMEKIELSSAAARLPFNICSELVSDSPSPLLKLDFLRVKSFQYGVRRADNPTDFEIN